MVFANNRTGRALHVSDRKIPAGVPDPHEETLPRRISSPFRKQVLGGLVDGVKRTRMIIRVPPSNCQFAPDLGQ